MTRLSGAGPLRRDSSASRLLPIAIAVKPGSPYETSELDDLRADQRRKLRHFPDWFVRDDVAPNVPDVELPPPSETARIEAGLRAQIAQLYLQGPIDLTFRMETISEYAALEDFVLAFIRCAGQENVPALITNLWIGVRAESFPRIDDLGGDTPWADAMVQLLILADRLANDGYIDPRLEESTP